MSMRALIFDLDGTLVDTVYAHVSRGNEPLQKQVCRSMAGASTVEAA
jgi:beta-phosphoglucomutase-like phosphatase (HAD superfamily)